MKNTLFASAGLFFLALLLASNCPGADQTSKDAFKQAIAEYQKSHPTARFSEEVYIEIANTLEQLPPVPEEERRDLIQGGVLFREAKTIEDFLRVQVKFEFLVRRAPWWPDAHYNLALTHEILGKLYRAEGSPEVAAKHFDEAVRHLGLYLKFKLPAAEAREVRDRLYELEAVAKNTLKDREREKESRARVAAAAAAAAEVKAREKREKEDAFVRSLDGTQYEYGRGLPNSKVFRLEIRSGHPSVIVCREFVTYRHKHAWQEMWQLPFWGRTFSFKVNRVGYFTPDSGVLSEDGNTITCTVIGSSHPYVFTRCAQREG